MARITLRQPLDRAAEHDCGVPHGSAPWRWMDKGRGRLAVGRQTDVKRRPR
jgi:hypothetical protein